jgi:hypothetical protein
MWKSGRMNHLLGRRKTPTTRVVSLMGGGSGRIFESVDRFLCFVAPPRAACEPAIQDSVPAQAKV